MGWRDAPLIDESGTKIAEPRKPSATPSFDPRGTTAVAPAPAGPPISAASPEVQTKDLGQFFQSQPATVGEFQEVPDNRIGFGEQLGREFDTPARAAGKIPILGGAIGAAESLQILDAGQRLSSGFDYKKPVRPAELRAGPVGSVPARFSTKKKDQKLIGDFLIRAAEEQERGFTFGGRVAQGLVALPTWMTEFALTGGLESIGSAAAKSAGKRLLKSYAKSKAGQVALKTAGWSAGAITRASVGLSPRIAEETLERQVGVQILGQEEEGWATSFAKAWGNVTIEAASETAGAAITGIPVKILNKTKFGRKFIGGLRSGWMKATGGTSGAFARKMASKGGYSTLLGEVGEERLGTVLRGVTNVDDFGAGPDAGPLDRAKAGLIQDWENIGVELVVLSVPGAAQVIAGTAAGAAQAPGATDVAQPDIPPISELELEQPDQILGEGEFAEQADQAVTEAKVDVAAADVAGMEQINLLVPKMSDEQLLGTLAMMRKRAETAEPQKKKELLSEIEAIEQLLAERATEATGEVAEGEADEITDQVNEALEGAGGVATNLATIGRMSDQLKAAVKSMDEGRGTAEIVRDRIEKLNTFVREVEESEKATKRATPEAPDTAVSKVQEADLRVPEKPADAPAAEGIQAVGDAQRNLLNAIKKHGSGGILDTDQHPEVQAAKKVREVAENELFDSLSGKLKIGDTVTAEIGGETVEFTLRQAKFDLARTADTQLQTGVPITFAFSGVEGVSTDGDVRTFQEDVVGQIKSAEAFKKLEAQPAPAAEAKKPSISPAKPSEAAPLPVAAKQEIAREDVGEPTPEVREEAGAEVKPIEMNFTQFASSIGKPSDFDVLDHGDLSPSGKVSKRSRKAAQARQAERLKQNNEAHDAYREAILAGDIIDPSGKFTKEDFERRIREAAERKREGRRAQIRSQIQFTRDLGQGKRGLKPTARKTIGRIEKELEELDKATTEAEEVKAPAKPKPAAPKKAAKAPAVEEETKGEADVKEEKAITEPTPSPEVQQRVAGEAEFEPTGTLDPSNEKDALEIVQKHRDYLQSRSKDFRYANEGIYKIKWETIENVPRQVIDEVIYTSEQVDTAYRTVQTQVDSPLPDTMLWAMPGKEKQMQVIGTKMTRMKKLATRKKAPSIGGPKAIPKAKTAKEDHIKAIGVARSSEEVKAYSITGLLVDGDKLVATDGRRMFIAKGKWGKDGLYLNVDYKKGTLGKLDTSGAKFPAYEDIIPDYPSSDAIIIDDLPTVWNRLQRASLLTTEETKGVVVILNEDGSLGFASQSPEVGHVEINVNQGGKILGGINPSFVLEALAFHAQRGDKTIELFFPQPDRAILTTSIGGKTRTVTMPITVEGARGADAPEAVKRAIETDAERAARRTDKEIQKLAEQEVEAEDRKAAEVAAKDVLKKNGIDVHIEQVEEITPEKPDDDVSLEIRGRPTGATLTQSDRQIILLAYGADSQTGYHEGYHVIRPRLTAADRSVLAKEFANEEAEAAAFGRYAQDRSTQKGRVKLIFQKLLRFLRQIRAALRREGFRTAESIFQDITTGQVRKVSAVLGDARVSFEMREPSDVFYSKLERAVAAKMPNKMDAQAFKNWLTKQGIKPDETKWTGIDELIEKGGVITKQQVRETLETNNVQIEEVVKGGPAVDARERDLHQIHEEVLDLNRKLSEHLRGLQVAFGALTPEQDARWQRVPADTAQILFRRAVGINASRHEQQEATRELQSFGAQYNWAALDEDNLRERQLIGEREAMRAEQGEGPQFEQYTLPGGTNYREVLLTLPTGHEEAERVFQKRRQEIVDKHGGAEGAKLLKLETKSEKEELQRLARAVDATTGFTSPHFPEKNILTHIRLTDRTNKEGQKVLFIEEIQSDWMQAGRKKGFAGQKEIPLKWEGGDKISLNLEVPGGGLKVTPDARQWTGTNPDAVYMITFNPFKNAYIVNGGRAFTLQNAHRPSLEDAKETARANETKDTGLVPDAPFKKTWHELAFKRVLRFAAEEGYDVVAWTTGEQQADRFDLSQGVDAIRWDSDVKDTFVMLEGVKGVSDQDIELVVTTDTGVVRVTDLGAEQFKGKELADIVGKDIADKILKNETGRLEGEGLKIGGQGMKAFYDRHIPNFARKYLKKWSGAVGTTEIEAKADPRDLSTPVTVHAVDVTPAMSKSVLEGQVKFETRPGDTQREAERKARVRVKVERMKAERKAAKATPSQKARAIAAGSTTIIPDMAAELHEIGIKFYRNPQKMVRAATNLVIRNLQRATNYMRTLGSSGKKLADDIDWITFLIVKKTGRDIQDLRNVYKGIGKRRREQLSQIINGRLEPSKVPARIREKAKTLRAILDRSMNAASDLDMKRTVQGKRIPIGGVGKAYPQALNREGVKFTEEAAAQGQGSARVFAWAQGQVTAGNYESVDAAITALQNFRDSRLRGVNTYLESERIELPEEFIEWDGLHTLPTLIERNWTTVEGVRQWGENFGLARSRIEKIKAEHGVDNAYRVDLFIETSFGIRSIASEDAKEASRQIRGFQFITKVGLSPLTIMRNMTDRIAKGFTISPLSTIKTFVKYPPFINQFIRSSQKHEDWMIRSGAVFGHGSLSEGYEAGSVLTELASAPFSASERGNQVFIAMVRYDKLLRDISTLKGKDKVLARMMDPISFIWGSGKRALKFRIGEAGGEKVLEKALAGEELNQEEIEFMLHVTVRDKAFPMVMSTKPIWYDNHPFIKVLAQFKTWPMQQLNMIYRDVAKYTVKTGDPTRLIGFLVGTLIAGEIYNIMRDFLFDKEESILNQYSKDEEEREIAWAILNDLLDGGVVGMLADFTYGVKDWVAGVSANTAKNLKDTVVYGFKSPRLIPHALERLLEKEVTPYRQIKRLADKFDRKFFNENNISKQHYKWRAEGWKFRDAKKNPTAIDKVKAYTDRVLMGSTDYGISEDTLALELASRQIIVGDVGDAAKYLKVILRGDDDRAAAVKRIRSSKTSRSPLGKVAMKDRGKFFKGYSLKSKREAIAVQAKYLRMYGEALVMAAKQLRESKKKP